MSDGPYRIVMGGGNRVVEGPGVSINCESSITNDSVGGIVESLNTAYAAGVEAGRNNASTPPRVTDAHGMGLDYHAGRIDGHADAVRELREKVERLEARGRWANVDDDELGITDTDWQRRAEIAEAQVKAARDFIGGYLSHAPSPKDGNASGTLQVVLNRMNAAREEAGTA